MADTRPQSHEPSYAQPVVTELLHRASSGDSVAVRELFPVVYEQLKAIAAARLAIRSPGHSLQATALVHEAYLKLVSGSAGDSIGFASRAQFFAAASRSMRNILVDHARARLADKRGGGNMGVQLADHLGGKDVDPAQILELHELLNALETHDQRKASIVAMRFFGGMTGDEIAAVLGTTPRTVDREWRYARAWMQARWEGTSSGETADA